MTNETKNTNNEQTAESKGYSCMEMMAQMIGQMGEEMNCETIISQFMSSDEIPDDWAQKMSEMAGSMNSCCGVQVGPEKKETS